MIGISSTDHKEIQNINKQIQTIQMPNGAVYKGEVRQGKPWGRGTMIYSNSERYEGEFKQGHKHGKGKYYYLKGELYIGDWYQNKKHGKGQYFYEDGKRYTGEFKDNMKNGYGRIEQENSSYYEGYFLMNNKDKVGEYYDFFKEKKFMITYDNGKKIQQRQIIDVPLGDAQKQKNDGNEFKVIMSVDGLGMNELKFDSPLENTFRSNVEPIIHSLRNLGGRKTQQQENQHQTLIAQHFFDTNLISKRILQWSKEEVSAWLNQIGFGDCIQQFVANNIQGDSLLTLQNHDLKQLNVAALGDRRILLRQIQFLRLIFKSQCVGDSISKFIQNQVSLKLVRELQNKRNQRQEQKMKVIEAVITSSSSSSSSDQQHNSRRKNTRSHSSQSKEKRSKIQNIQTKVETYMQKKGIKLTFLIPKQQIQIIQPIGRGGYGQVYLGRWLGQDVAVKKYLKKQGFRNKHIGHFIQQVQVINRLLHPSIVLYMGMCIYDNQYGMVTEFLSGGSLFDFLHKKKQKLSEERIFYIMKDVALGMSYLHGKNVLHCDLKSSNVLIDESWNVKLCDFGLSRINNAKTKKKKNNIRVGTPHWMAPQILKGQKYECQSDIYSFGILLWQMLTGQIPYKDLSTAQIIGLVGNDDNHHISIPNYPNKVFLEIFLACTEKQPKKRPTFKVIVNVLENNQAVYLSNDP